MSAQTSPYETVVTSEGYEALQAELAELTREGRARMADALQQARAITGAVGENVELLEVWREQERLESRIAVLEELVRIARVADEADLVPGTAGVGSEVAVEDVDEGAADVFRLVGSPEAAPVEGWISIESPVGRALLGRRRGDVVEVETPKGLRRLRVRRVRLPRVAGRRAR